VSGDKFAYLITVIRGHKTTEIENCRAKFCVKKELKMPKNNRKTEGFLIIEKGEEVTDSDY